MITEDEILEYLIKAYGDDEQPVDLKVHGNESMRMQAKKPKQEPKKNVDELRQDALKLYFG